MLAGLLPAVVSVLRITSNEPIQVLKTEREIPHHVAGSAFRIGGKSES
jgi:hypothetical protein